MSEPYDQMLAALRDRTGWVHLDVRPPRDAPIKQCVAYLFAREQAEPGTSRSQTASVAVTATQARELLDAGARWTGPAHLQAEVVAGA